MAQRKVRAVKAGFYGRLRQPGEVFSVSSDAVARIWMRPVSTPKKLNEPRGGAKKPAPGKKRTGKEKAE